MKQRPVNDEWGTLTAFSVADIETLAKLIGGTAATSRPCAQGLLTEAQSLWALRRWSRRRLRGAGLSAAAIIRLDAAFELGARSLLPPCGRQRLLGPRDSFAFVARYFVGCARERFIAVALDAKSRPLHVAFVALGSVDACPVDPREVFRPAIGEGASAVLLAHNHPSGDATPSADDLALTERLIAAGELLGVRVLDHLVVAVPGVEPTPSHYVSLVAAGLWPREGCASHRRPRNPGGRRVLASPGNIDPTVGDAGKHTHPS